MTDLTKQKIRKRCFFRFSLRTFLIILTIFCVWIGWYVYRVEQQRVAVKWVRDNGGGVAYDYELTRSQSSVPPWLLTILDVNYFSNVVSVTLISNQVSDLPPLACLTNLEELWLINSQVSDLTPIAGLTNLERLWLSNSLVTDLTSLAGLKHLEQLDLGGTPANDLTPLAGLTNLEELDLQSTKVNDLTPLSCMTELNYLYLSEMGRVKSVWTPALQLNQKRYSLAKEEPCPRMEFNHCAENTVA